MIGNCLVCAVYKYFYLLFKGSKNNRFMMRWYKGDPLPHFYVGNDYFVWDFSLDEDIVRWPFYYLIYRGYFRRTRREAFERSKNFNWDNEE
jgi:hypothetical protein